MGTKNRIALTQTRFRKHYKMIKITETKFRRKYHTLGYEYRREIWDIGDGHLCEIAYCYSLENNHAIGNPRMARFLAKKGIRKFQKSHSSHSVCSIGFNEDEQKWYGWSHRAICGFGIGDRIFEERYGNKKTPFTKHGRKTIKTINDAKLAAKRFARCVS